MQERVCTGGTVIESTTDCIACRHRLCTLLNPDHMIRFQRFRHLARGECLDLTGTRSCLQLHVVLTGGVALCSTLADGRRQIIGLEMPGDLFCGLSASDMDNARIEAVSDSRICEIDLSPVAESLLRNPDFSRRLFRLTHRELEAASAHITVLGRLDSMERLCLFLADMAWRIGTGDGTSRRVSLPMSREDIADYLGLNAETISRVFSRIKKARLAVFLSPTDYIVPDLPALESRLPVRPPSARWLGAESDPAPAAFAEGGLS